MKRIRIYLIVLVISNCAHCQEINFNSYSSVTDTSFSSFLSKFDKKELPISTDLILSEINLRKLRKEPLSQAEVDRFLRKENKELITGPLYKEVQEEGLPVRIVTGDFIPLFKLPSNGDYVLLVFAQAEMDTNKDCVGLIFTLSYSINGKYIYFSNYTYRPGTENINALIDVNLQSHLFYVINEVNGKIQFPPLDRDFEAKEGHLIYQINSNGRSTQVSFEKSHGKFKFSKEECRFMKID
jgi:hypothetical protein